MAGKLLKMRIFGSSLILWAQAIFSSLDQETGPLAYTASDPNGGTSPPDPTPAPPD